jgi:hypothetical protein
VRRTLESVTSRHLHVGEMHIDLPARSVAVAGTVVCLSPLEFKLLVTFAGDPLRVFSKHELGHLALRDQRADRRKPRLPPAYPPGRRRRRTVLVNRWGHGWSLTTAH